MIWVLNNRILAALSLIASTKNNKLTKFRFMGLFFFKKKKAFVLVLIKSQLRIGTMELNWILAFSFCVLSLGV